MPHVSEHDVLIRLDRCTDVFEVVEGINQTGVQFLHTALATSAARIHGVLLSERVRTARPRWGSTQQQEQMSCDRAQG